MVMYAEDRRMVDTMDVVNQREGVPMAIFSICSCGAEQHCSRTRCEKYDFQAPPAEHSEVLAASCARACGYSIV
jgi:hypothetical protein